MKHLIIITGASRGMGLAMARQLCRPDVHLLGLSRQISGELQEHARSTQTLVEQWPADLSQPYAVVERLTSWLATLKANEFSSATLINNAGMLGTLAPVETISAAELASGMAVNLVAPMQLTSAFLRETAQWSCPRKVMNISSGLAARAQAGSSMYCASKAGLDHFSRCVALEQAQAANGAHVVSVYPGVIDTDMQSDLRASDSRLFPARSRYVELKTAERLTSPDEAAARLLRYLDRVDYGQEPVVNILDHV
jgi:benzil reductase ((S)-benzoin forming)